MAEQREKFVEKRGDKSYYVRGTFTRNNLDFTKDFELMTELGFKEISIEPVVTPDENDYAIREEDLPTIFEQYDKLADVLRSSLDLDAIYKMMGL